MPNEPIFTVSALTSIIKERVETALPFVWVRGQVSNLARPQSGHVFFSLKDERSSLAAVWFKGGQKPFEEFDPLTGEVYEGGPRPSLAHSLEDGQEVVCAGRLAVYAARGEYRLLVEIAQRVGLGRLHEEFRLLRDKLARQGYFAPGRKRSLPIYPQRIAVLTAPGGAAIHDFLRIARSRGPGASILIHPVPVQGEAAPTAILDALRRVYAERWAEVIVLIRGGGSPEDLWAFNDEALATAIFTSPVPVLAGIGHEVDYTFADMTADVRAATPTHAAEILWPDRAGLVRQVLVEEKSLGRAAKRFLERADSLLDAAGRHLAWRSPQRAVLNLEERLLLLERRFKEAPKRLLASRTQELRHMAAALERVPLRLPSHFAAHTALAKQLRRAGQDFLTQAGHNLEKNLLRLEAANPHVPLQRGYALVRKEDGSLVTHAKGVLPGDLLRIILRDGEIPARVEGEKTNGKKGS